MPKYKQLQYDANTFIYSSIKELPDSFNTDMISGKATADWSLQRNSLQIVDNTTGKFIDYKLKTKEVTYLPDCPAYSTHSAMVSVQDYNFYFDNATKKVYKFNQNTKTWAYVGLIPLGNSYDGITAIVSMQYAYIISKNLTQSKASKVFQRINCYNNKWQSLPSLPVAHRSPLLLSRKHSIWLTGGSTSWSNDYANCNYIYQMSLDNTTLKWEEKAKPSSKSSPSMSEMIDPNSTITPYGITGDKLVFRDSLSIKTYDVNSDKWTKAEVSTLANSYSTIQGGICMHEGYKEQNLFPDGSPCEVMAIGARLGYSKSSESCIIGGAPVAILYGNSYSTDLDTITKKLSFNLKFESNTTYIESFKITDVKLINRLSAPPAEGESEAYCAVYFFGGGTTQYIKADQVVVDASNLIREYKPLEEGIKAGKSYTKVTDIITLDLSKVVDSINTKSTNTCNMALDIHMEYTNTKTGNLEKIILPIEANANIFSSYATPSNVSLEGSSDFVEKLKLTTVEQRQEEFFQDTIKSQNSAFYKNKLYIPYLTKQKEARIAEIDKDTFAVKSHKVFLNQNIIDTSKYPTCLPFGVVVYQDSLYLLRGYTDECYNTYTSALYIYKVNEKDFSLEFHKQVLQIELHSSSIYGLENIYDIFQVGENHIGIISATYGSYYIDMRKDCSEHKYFSEIGRGPYVEAGLYHKTGDLYATDYSSVYAIDKNLNLRREDILFRDYDSRFIPLTNRREVLLNCDKSNRFSTMVHRLNGGQQKGYVTTALNDFKCGEELFRNGNYLDSATKVNYYVDDNSDIYVFFSGICDVEDVMTHQKGKKICGAKFAMPEKRYLYSIDGKIYKSNVDDAMILIPNLTESNITEQDYLTHGDKVVNANAINGISDANSIDILMYHEESEEFDALTSIELDSVPQLLVCDFDLGIDPAVTVKKVKALAETKEASDIMIAISTDSGNSWKTFANDTAQEISLEQIRERGIDVDSFNFLTAAELTNLIPRGTESIRFAFNLKPHRDFNPKLDHILIRG